MASPELIKAFESAVKYTENRDSVDEKVIDACVQYAACAYVTEKDVEYGKVVSKFAHEVIDKWVFEQTKGGHIDDLEYYCGTHDVMFPVMENYFEILRIEAPFLVDSFFRYIEMDEKNPKKRFYFPRAKRLRPIVEAYQDIYEGKLDFLSVSQPKRTGKTTSGLKLCQMMAGRSPEGSIFATGKGEGLVKRFYGGLLEAFEDSDQYKRFLKVFPEAKKTKDYKSAENLSIDLKKKSVFSTVTCRPIDGAIVGCTEANVLVYIDDCVKNHEEARSRERLEFLCEKVTDDVLGRRLEGTPIIIQGTKYSLYDPITALQEKANLLEWRWKEVAIPALDPVTDESNWEIEREGKKIFTTDYYRKERMLVTPETWAAEFQQEPYEAKGRLFPESDLNRFEELPVDREPDAIMAACDTAKDGGDYCSMPIGYVYGNEVYIVDVVFDNSGSKHTIPECANKIIEHNVKTITFESNAAGSFFGKDVMDMVAAQGGRCSAKYKFNTANKITRMENAQLNILKDYYFLARGKYAIGSQYDLFMKNVTTMTRSGKVAHDDGPDSLALLENEMRSGTTRPAVIMSSPI